MFNVFGEIFRLDHCSVRHSIGTKNDVGVIIPELDRVHFRFISRIAACIFRNIDASRNGASVRILPFGKIVSDCIGSFRKFGQGNFRAVFCGACSDEFAGESRIKAYRVDFVAVFCAESRITRKIVTAAEKFGTVNRPIFKRFALMLRRLGKSLCHNGISDGHIQSFQHLFRRAVHPLHGAGRNGVRSNYICVGCYCQASGNGLSVRTPPMRKVFPRNRRRRWEVAEIQHRVLCYRKGFKRRSLSLNNEVHRVKRREVPVPVARKYGMGVYTLILIIIRIVFTAAALRIVKCLPDIVAFGHAQSAHGVQNILEDVNIICNGHGFIITQSNGSTV